MVHALPWPPMTTWKALALAAALAATPAAGATAQAPNATRPVRILFIGNSYTYFNNLPGILEDFARAATPGRLVETELVAVGGATLQQHWGSGAALERIHRKGWDYVVLQEQSMLGWAQVDGRPVVNRPDQFHRAVRLFDREIRLAGAKTVLYHTWSAKDSPADQAALDRAYQSIGKELGAVVVPVGAAWDLIRATAPAVELYHEDGRHPSAAGSWLAAAVFSKTLLGALPNNAPSRIVGPRYRPDDGAPLDSVGPLVDLDSATARVLLEAAAAAQPLSPAAPAAAAEGDLTGLPPSRRRAYVRLGLSQGSDAPPFHPRPPARRGHLRPRGRSLSRLDRVAIGWLGGHRFPYHRPDPARQLRGV